NYGQRLIGMTKPVPSCGRGVRIGLIDTAVDTSHPALQGQSIVTQSFLTPGVTPAAADHGTASAALLVGKPLPNGFSGLVPGAKLYAASVFRRQDDRDADTTAESVVKALNWLAGQNVQIINLNFGGHRNLLLEAAIDRLIKRGIVVVVAVGNDGSDTPTYPAAQSGVVAVTAVDANSGIYGKANRGQHISFAAPGVEVWSAATGKDGKTYTGTSYATPFVTAVLAMARQAAPTTPWPALIKNLQTAAKDLGDPGQDPVYGWGLIQVPAVCSGRR
ncbi:MAG: S8 family serine peptidase, partial [Pseudomonadota bacterium]